MVKSETKMRILDAAEQLFAAHGIGGTSLRAIIVKAGVNVAAIHYHFGSKMALTLAVFSRRLEPINQEQHRLLARCEKTECCLEDVLHAFILPVLAVRDDNDEGAEAFLRILSNTFIEPDEALFRALYEQFGDALNRFVGTLRKTLPELTDEDFQVRFLFALGAFSFSIGEALRRTVLGEFEIQADITVEKLVRFLSAGFKAPPEPPPT